MGLRRGRAGYCLGDWDRRDWRDQSRLANMVPTSRIKDVFPEAARGPSTQVIEEGSDHEWSRRHLERKSRNVTSLIQFSGFSYLVLQVFSKKRRHSCEERYCVRPLHLYLLYIRNLDEKIIFSLQVWWGNLTPRTA